MEIQTGMVFALETYCPAADGYSAARIEEEVVVTETGCEVISLFPAERNCRLRTATDRAWKGGCLPPIRPKGRIPPEDIFARMKQASLRGLKG